MTRPMTRVLSCALGVACSLAALTGCGGGGSGSEVVARVTGGSDGKVTRAQFDRWMQIGLQTLRAADATTPDPPRFNRCVAATQQQYAGIHVPKGAQAAAPSAAQLRRSCQARYDKLRQDTMNFLLETIWIQREAGARGIRVDSAELKTQIRAEQQLLPHVSGGLDAKLEAAGMTRAELRYRALSHALAEKLGKQQLDGQQEPTARQLAAFEARHAADLMEPERRDLLIVVTANRTQAQTALRRLRAGESFARVAAKYSIEPASRAAGARHPGYRAGQVGEQAIDQAISSARVGALEGPLHDSRGYFWVFRVTRVIPPLPLPASQARAKALAALNAQRSSRLLKPFRAQLHARWKLRTTCVRAFASTDCRGVPDRRQGA